MREMDSEPNYLDFVNEVGRVRIATAGRERLPLEVRFEIAGRVAWLRGELQRLDKVLGLTYPPITVYPVCWILEVPSGPVHAGVRPVRRQADSWYLGVDVSAASLLAFPDAILRGILAHEFRHYVHDTLMIHEAVLSGNSSLTTVGREPQTFDEYRRLEPERQVPEHWLGEELAALARRAERSTDPEVISGLASLKTEWLERGYPAEVFDRKYQTSGYIVLDTTAVAWAAEHERRTTEDTRR